MKYIDAVEGSIIAIIVFSIVVVLLPGIGPSSEVEIILTISTFLFAILAGFFITRSNSRYNGIVELVAEEDATMLSIYKTAQQIGKKFSDSIREIIDKYYIIAYDFELYNYPYKLTEKYFLKIWDELKKIKKKGIAYEKMIEELSELEKNRNKAEALSSEKLGRGQWLILIFLAGIILFSIFYLKVPQLYSQIITVLLSTVLILVLLIIRDLQNIMLGGTCLLGESGQETLEFIGKPRYYHKSFLDRGVNRVPKFVKEYRLGTHKPGSEKFEIKFIKKK